MNAILKMNSRGTLTLPKALRNMLGLNNGGTLMCSLREDGVVLQPAKTYPVEMYNGYPIEIYTDERIAEFDAEDAASADAVDKLYEKMGWEYDPQIRAVHEKGVPYMKRKKKA